MYLNSSAFLMSCLWNNCCGFEIFLQKKSVLPQDKIIVCFTLSICSINTIWIEVLSLERANTSKSTFGMILNCNNLLGIKVIHIYCIVLNKVPIWLSTIKVTLLIMETVVTDLSVKMCLFHRDISKEYNWKKDRKMLIISWKT